MADITMPQLGETVTEGTITKWMKQVGDEVKEDEVLFEVSTDKVDSEVPSPASGYLSEILVPEGETVDVGAKLAVISAEPVSGNGGAPAEDKAEAPAEEKADDAAPEAEAEPEPKAEEQKDDTVDEGETADETASDDAAEPEPEPKAKQAAPQPSAGTRPADERPPSKPAGGGG